MQSSKKKLLKIIGLILLIIAVGAGWWAADFFLIPKVQQKGVTAPVDLHPAQEAMAWRSEMESFSEMNRHVWGLESLKMDI